MKTTLLPIVAQSSHSFFSAFVEALDRRKNKDLQIRSGFAFVTLAGIQRMLSDCGSIEKWLTTKKNFLVGIHHGISEPSALDRLCSIPNSDVRIYLPNNRMELRALSNSPVFHPKVLAICDSTGEEVFFLQSGSANLTKSAIGERPLNHEFAFAIDAADSNGIGDGNKHSEWWERLWDASKPVTSKRIRQYAKLRRTFSDSNPSLKLNTEVPQGIGKARNFFIEVGAGSGPPGERHQVEFPKALASFFGRCIRKKRMLTLQDSKGVITPRKRPLSFKTTTFGVDIWRLGMPTIRMGGEPISEKVILFQRTSNRKTYKYEITPTGSSKMKDWIESANSIGHIGATYGKRPRQYGFWDFRD